MIRRILFATAAIALAGAPVFAAGVEKAPPGGAFAKLSDLVKLPAFMPGLGVLYVDPKTLPKGPFLAYDRAGLLVSTVYMIPLKDFETHRKIEALDAPGRQCRPRRHVVQRRPSGGRGAALPGHSVAHQEGRRSTHRRIGGHGSRLPPRTISCGMYRG